MGSSGMDSSIFLVPSLNCSNFSFSTFQNRCPLMCLQRMGWWFRRLISQQWTMKLLMTSSLSQLGWTQSDLTWVSMRSGLIFLAQALIWSLFLCHISWYSLYRYRFLDCLVISICCSLWRLDRTVFLLMVVLNIFFDVVVWLNYCESPGGAWGGYLSLGLCYRGSMYLEMSFFLNSFGPTKSQDSCLWRMEEGSYQRFSVQWNMLLVMADFERCLSGLMTESDPFIQFYLLLQINQGKGRIWDVGRKDK